MPCGISRSFLRGGWQICVLRFLFAALTAWRCFFRAISRWMAVMHGIASV